MTVDTLNYPSYKLWLRNNELFVFSYKGFRIYDVTSPQSPVRISEFYDPSAGEGQDGYVDDSLVYFANQYNGLDIVDIADSSSPTKIGSLNHQIPTKNIYKAGNTLFMTDENNKLRIVDVSDPTHPVEKDSMTFNDQITGFARKDSLLFFGGNNKIYVLNISNPSIPVLTDTLSINAYSTYYDMLIDSSNLYIASWNYDLPYVNLSDLSNLVTKSVPLNDEVSSVYATDQYIFAGLYHTGITIIDKSLLFGSTDTTSVDTTGNNNGGNGGGGNNNGGNGGGNTTAIPTTSLSQAFTPVPNPCNTYFEFSESQVKAGTLRIQLYDMQGRLCKSINLSAEELHHRIDISDLSPGMYIYKIRNKDKIVTGKIIKRDL